MEPLSDHSHDFIVIETDDECYVSIDIEADGPAPGLNSMLSLGAVAFTSDGALVDTFSANLEAREDPKTMRWWAKQPEAWAACRTQIRDPPSAMLAATHRSAPEGTGRRPSRPLICR